MLQSQIFFFTSQSPTFRTRPNKRGVNKDVARRETGTPAHEHQVDDELQLDPSNGRARSRLSWGPWRGGAVSAPQRQKGGEEGKGDDVRPHQAGRAEIKLRPPGRP